MRSPEHTLAMWTMLILAAASWVAVTLILASAGLWFCIVLLGSAVACSLAAVALATSLEMK